MDRYCSSCGKEIDREDKFCPYCGASTDLHEVPPVKTKSKKKIKKGKSRPVAGLMGVLLGAFGIHNFYLGFYFRGFIQLFVTIITSLKFAPFMYIWGVTEGILILSGSMNSDSKGNPLVD